MGQCHRLTLCAEEEKTASGVMELLSVYSVADIPMTLKGFWDRKLLTNKTLSKLLLILESLYKEGKVLYPYSLRARLWHKAG